jgi:hypothetical protein
MRVFTRQTYRYVRNRNVDFLFGTYHETIPPKTITINQSLNFSENIEYSISSASQVAIISEVCPLIYTTPTIVDIFYMTDCFNYQLFHRPTIYVNNVSHTLQFEDSFDPHLRTSINQIVTQSLIFDETIDSYSITANTILRTISQELAFTETFSGYLATPTTPHFSDSISFSDSFSFQKISNITITDQLTFIQMTCRNVNYNRSFSDQLVFGAKRIINNKVVNVPDVVVIDIPRQLKKLKFMKLVCNSSAVILPAPNFANSYNAKTEIKIGRTMTGGSRSYIKPNGEKAIKYNFTLTEAKKEELFSFFRNYNAEHMFIYDWKNSLWLAYLTSSTLSGTSSGRDKVDLDLEFEGLKIS